jgi:hypothetical protein
VGRYLELARRSIEALHANAQLPAQSEDISQRQSRYEINETNERSLSATSAHNASERHMVTVAAWAAGVARLRATPPPPNYPQHAWTQLIIDAEWFMGRWGTQAARLGWQDWELFGCCRHAPWSRVQGLGLVLLLHGRELVALTEVEAVINTRTGARQTYRRKPADPLFSAERCMAWELIDG